MPRLFGSLSSPLLARSSGRAGAYPDRSTVNHLTDRDIERALSLETGGQILMLTASPSQLRGTIESPPWTNSGIRKLRLYGVPAELWRPGRPPRVVFARFSDNVITAMDIPIGEVGREAATGGWIASSFTATPRKYTFARIRIDSFV